MIKKLSIFSLFLSSMIIAMEHDQRVTALTDSAEKKAQTAAEHTQELLNHNVPRKFQSWRTRSYAAISVKDLLGDYSEDAAIKVIDSTPTSNTKQIIINCNKILPCIFLISLIASGLAYQIRYLSYIKN